MTDLPSAPTSAPEPTPLSDLRENANERRMFDSECQNLYVGDPLRHVAASLTILHLCAPDGGSYREVLAIYANEVAKAMVAIQSLTARIAALTEALVTREARRLELLDWIEHDIGTAWECPHCHYATYHAFNNECAECGADFPLQHLMAFKLHASGTDNDQYIEKARAALAHPEPGRHKTEAEEA